MQISRVANVSLALALAGTMFGVASAQDSNGDVQLAQPAQPTSVEVEFGGYIFELPADEPVVACVTFRSQDLSGDDALEYRLFVREPSGEFSSTGLYPSPAIGALADANAGDCTSLEGFENAE
jgi:hypothetical protein